jgi:DNA-binding PadR family transcriptional regulator
MLGELEQIVLLGVLRAGSDAYGVTILREIEREAGRELTLATIYKTLGRLEDKGYVTSRLGDPTPQRGGRRKRYYVVAPLGERALSDALRSLERMSRGLAIGLRAP